MNTLAWYILFAVCLVAWALPGFIALFRAPVREDLADAERPALPRKVMHQLSAADRLRRKSEGRAKKAADRTARQIRAHLHEFTEARQVNHV